MKTSKGIKAFLEKARQGDSYWVENAKLEFAVMLEQRRRMASMSLAELAKKIGTSAAYISKVFRGDSNLTIESMVKLARATGGQLDIRIVEPVSAVSHWDASKFKILPKHSAKLTLVASSSVTYVDTVAANGNHYDWDKAAA